MSLKIRGRANRWRYIVGSQRIWAFSRNGHGDLTGQRRAFVVESLLNRRPDLYDDDDGKFRREISLRLKALSRTR